MCPPKMKKQTPAASTSPTMQAAEELELITDGLQDNALGRAALRTAGGAARKPASASAAAQGEKASAPAAAPSPAGAAGVLDLAAPVGGRRAGSRQPFYNPEGSTE